MGVGVGKGRTEGLLESEQNARDRGTTGGFCSAKHSELRCNPATAGNHNKQYDGEGV